MVRTIVQLREDQHVRLRELAAARGTSIAALVRAAVDEILSEQQRDRQARLDAIAQLIALGAAGPRDLAREHDRHLGESDEW